jgi:predicted helicase
MASTTEATRSYGSTGLGRQHPQPHRSCRIHEAVRRREAVQYFYEPFLQAFDPVLRKQFGVWYTPAEVVDYMVARVDLALKQDLGIADGLADERVYVLDPCCGTGGFVIAVLRRIRDNLQSHGLGDAMADRLRHAATARVFGFEIMPAPFVVAHLQAGLALSTMDALLPEDARPAIYLTNALTGWEPHINKPLPFPELEQERASADAVKLVPLHRGFDRLRPSEP